MKRSQVFKWGLRLEFLNREKKVAADIVCCFVAHVLDLLLVPLVDVLVDLEKGCSIGTSHISKKNRHLTKFKVG